MVLTRDIVSDTKRSEMMRAVRQRGTSAERPVQEMLRDLGARYRLNHPALPGRPDFANRSGGWALFVHGCFWHGHRNCRKTKGGASWRLPATNAEFWAIKIRANRKRDSRKSALLRELGLRVLVVWECELRDRTKLRQKLVRFLALRPTGGRIRRVGANGRLPGPRSMNVVGLFAGIGGIELGLTKAGHRTLLLCENDPAAGAVLKARFSEIPRVEDVRELDALPSGTELLAAGFPCQDLSQAGDTRGIKGARSGLVADVFRLLERQRVPWVLLENVPFMLQLGRGAAMGFIVTRLEELGYRWAYRVLDTRAFGLPQRRERVFLLASLDEDPAHRLFRGNRQPSNGLDHRGRACGFYWTEGTRGLGWAVSAIPTLKGGSTVGIPSPPAIWMPDGRIVTPDIRDAERLQGFPVDWTKPAERVERAGFRWKLVGNAVTVKVAAWVGDRLAAERDDRPWGIPGGPVGRHWPKAAYGSRKGGRFAANLTTWPVSHKQVPIEDFLRYEPKVLSHKATSGFERRLSSSTLRAPDEFRHALLRHIDRMAASE